jgi:hypothetical protein
LFITVWANKLRKIFLYPMPSSEKRGFGDVNPRFTAGSMPNDDKKSSTDPRTIFEGESIPGPSDQLVCAPEQSERVH